ncbi:MAG: tRNA (adenosine(37)-N6)-dimethylallyltransferase MiaA [Pedobacter sp.]|nr:MAG: tRNA (adenosine(37)-N6)-dimethylallyltransferase MiaA [Pedobacter sp.]
MPAYPLLIILGPTASGKTQLAVQLAAALNGEVISADSRQVFKGMDIGTGKDLNEYIIGCKKIPYHLIDIKDAGERYNVNEFKDDFYRVFEQLSSSGKLPVLCGGTGMYIHSLLQNQEFTAVPVDLELRASLSPLDIYALRDRLSTYPDLLTKHADQSSHKRLIRAIEIAEYLQKHELAAVKRPEIRPLIIGLNPELTIRRARIEERLRLRFEQGLIAEVEQLKAAGLTDEMLDFYGLEYKFIGSYLRDELSLDELKDRLFIAICQFAKRQMTFFRKMEKDGVTINWLDTTLNSNQLYDRALALLADY